MKNYYTLLTSQKTVFTKNDIEKILKFQNKKSLDSFLYRAKKKGILQNISHGIYVVENYDIFELASKIKKKSYISLETVLKKQGVIFQYYDEIFLISDDTIKKHIGKQKFHFHKIKDSVLLNQIGLEHKKTYIIASVERAICDKIYLSKNYHFDDISEVNFAKLEEIAKIYNNKRVLKEVKKLTKKYAQ